MTYPSHERCGVTATFTFQVRRKSHEPGVLDLCAVDRLAGRLAGRANYERPGLWPGGQHHRRRSWLVTGKLLVRLAGIVGIRHDWLHHHGDRRRNCAAVSRRFCQETLELDNLSNLDVV